MPNQDIKPIETHYNGYRFRSRLEARWAVFFDALDIKYEYESEGYEFKDGTRYLPDFYLSELDMFVEIKPNKELKYSEIKKIILLTKSTNKEIILCCGVPNYQGLDIIGPSCKVCIGMNGKEAYETCQKLNKLEPFYLRHKYGVTSYKDLSFLQVLSWFRNISENLLVKYSNLYSKSIIKARSARFEFDEKQN